MFYKYSISFYELLYSNRNIPLFQPIRKAANNFNLGFDRLNIDDNFYELGGDSILATQVVNRINTGNNIKISLIEIFNYETIKELAEYVETLQSA